tara:strand:- start:12255 stop:15998 length:3744 start_codon:yes stop_codon:yes gene_type:complete
MALDKTKFNINPYYDDFNESNKFLQVLFKPGYAVQARELTQLQSILSNQIGRMADHIFENGDVIQGAGITEQKVLWFRISNTVETDLNLNDLIGYDLYYDHTVLNTNSGGSDAEAGSTTRVLGKVLHVEEATTDDPYRIVFVNITKETKDESVPFPAGQKEIKCSNPNLNVNLMVLDGIDNSGVGEDQMLAPARGDAILVSIDQGLFYVDGYFVMNDAQTIAIFELSDAGVRKFTPEQRTVSVGFSINRKIETANSDTTLRDPSQGSYNYNAPGADRFVIDLKIKQIPYIFDEDGYRTDHDTDNYFEWARIIKGETFKKLKYPEYAELEETLARRTYDESGHYTVDPFGFEAETYKDVWDPAVTGRADHYNYCACGIKTGKAYVRGYEFELQNTEHLVGKKAKTTVKQNDVSINIDLGNYILAEHNFDGTTPLFGINQAMDNNTMNLVGGDAEPEWKKVNLSFVGGNGEMIPVGCARINQIALHAINQGDLNVGSLFRVYLSDVVFGKEAGFVGEGYDLLTMKDVKHLADPDTGKSLFKLHIPEGFESNEGIQDQRRVAYLYPMPVGSAVKEVTGLDYYVQRDYELSFSYDSSEGCWKATATSPAGTEFQGNNNLGLGYMDDLANTDEYIVSVDGYLFDMNPYTSGDFGGNYIKMGSANSTIEIFLKSGKTLEWGTTGTKSGYLVTNIRANQDGQVESNKEESIRKKILKRKVVSITNSSNPNGTLSMFNSNLEDGYGLNLGYPDVLILESVKEIGTGKDYTDSFEFRPNQKPHLYDHAYMVLDRGTVGGTAGPEAAWAAEGAGFEVSFLYFDHQTWSEGDDHNDYSTLKYPLVANSYTHGDHEIKEFPNGEGGTANFGGTFDDTPEKNSTLYFVPPFIDPIDGSGVKLSNCVDFRPIKVGKWDENHPEFGKIRGTWTPQDGKLFYSDYEHYLPRIDTLVLDRSREFKIIEGIPGVDPNAPAHNDESEMAIFHISWPAGEVDCPDVMGVEVDNQRYTMRDIGNLEKRIETLELTTELNAIESEGKEEAMMYGTQFTNVLSVNHFKEIDNGDIYSNDYNVAIVPDDGYIMPSDSEMNLNLFEHSLKTSSDGITSSSDNLYYLTPSNVAVATVSNLTGNIPIYPNPFSKQNWLGDLRLAPSSDDWFAINRTVKKVRLPGRPAPQKPKKRSSKGNPKPKSKKKWYQKYISNYDTQPAHVKAVWDTPAYRTKRNAWVSQKYPSGGGWAYNPKNGGYYRCRMDLGCKHAWKE